MGKKPEPTFREVVDRQYVAWKRLRRLAQSVMNQHPAVNLKTAVLTEADKNLEYLERAMRGTPGE